MLVLVRGDPICALTEVIGLDILAQPHPQLYASILDKLGYKFDAATNIVTNRQGSVDDSCQADPTGRQICIKATMYPTDVVNCLVGTGGFMICSSTCQVGSIVVWSLDFKFR